MRHRAAKYSLTNAIGMKNIYRHLYQDIYGFPSSSLAFISAYKGNLASLFTGYLKIFENISSDSPAYLSPHHPHPPNTYYIYITYVHNIYIYIYTYTNINIHVFPRNILPSRCVNIVNI